MKLVSLLLSLTLLPGAVSGVLSILFLLLIIFPIALIIILAIVRWILRSPKKAPLTQMPVRTTTAIFISYRRDDTSDITGRIYDRLIQHFGRLSVFKDVDSIPLGVDFRKHLSDAVGKCDVLLTVIGNQWLIGDAGQHRLDDARDFVRIEIEAALQRDIPVIPVLVQAAPVPRVEELPVTLQSLVYRNGIPVRTDPDFHQDMDRLIRGIEEYLER